MAKRLVAEEHPEEYKTLVTGGNSHGQTIFVGGKHRLNSDFVICQKYSRAAQRLSNYETSTSTSTKGATLVFRLKSKRVGALNAL